MRNTSEQYMPHCVQICTDAAFFAPKKSKKNKSCAQFLQKQRESRKNGAFLNTMRQYVLIIERKPAAFTGLPTRGRKGGRNGIGHIAQIQPARFGQIDDGDKMITSTKAINARFPREETKSAIFFMVLFCYYIGKRKAYTAAGHPAHGTPIYNRIF